MKTKYNYDIALIVVALLLTVFPVMGQETLGVFDFDGSNSPVTWDATTDATFLTVEQSGFLDYSSIGGIPNNNASGVTGDVSVESP